MGSDFLGKRWHSVARPLLSVTVGASVAVMPVAAAPPAKRLPIHTQPTPKPEPAACAGLMADYEGASKKLAYNTALDSVDDSAPRATMRQSENATTIAQAQMTMDMMKSNGCKLPAFIPSATRYGSAFLHCAAAKQHIRTQMVMDRLNDHIHFYDQPAECDTSTWTPDK